MAAILEVELLIFDLDGTLFIKSPDRGYYDWNNVHLDTPKLFVKNLLDNYSKLGFKIILLSGVFTNHFG